MGHFKWKKPCKGTEVKRGGQSLRNHIYLNLVCSPFERMVGNKKRKGWFRLGHRGL